MPHDRYVARRPAAAVVDDFQRESPDSPSVIAMAAPIQVDIAAVRRLAAAPVGLASRLDADNTDGSCVGDWISDAKIRTALKDVQHDWSHKRHEFTGYLRSVGQAAQVAAEAYAQAEHQIAKAASP